jgi:hypothetical protein
MEILDRQGDYQIGQEGFWAVLLDADGNVLIPAEKHYRTISHVANGIAIGYVDGKYGLIDLHGNHIGEFKYGYITPCGEGFYRAEMGNKKNVLRPDGTEVLRVWFNDVYDVEKGFFIIGNTIRKTADHPTLYPRGLAHVNGDIIFPPIFNRLCWLDPVKRNVFYAEKDNKPYLITGSCSVINPEKDIFAKKEDEDAIADWKGPKGSICEGCIFSNQIGSNADGCGKLGKQDFRNNYIRGFCEHKKIKEDEITLDEEIDRYREKIAEEEASKKGDEYAVILLKGFIRDKLGGDIAKLKNFDFGTLSDDKKYGDCNGYSFSVEKCNTMKAIMALVFADAWPGLTYYAIEHYEFTLDILNTSTMLLGCPVGDELKGMTRFRPMADQIDRAWAFHSLHHTIGNYWVLPSKGEGLLTIRESIPRKFRYIDAFLSEFYKGMTGVKKMQMDIKASLWRARKYYQYYQEEGGFARMCDKLFLNDYVDYLGKPIELFQGVWSDQNDLTREEYFEALDQYLTFCEKVIPKRSEQMIKRLKLILDMGSDMIDNPAQLEIEMPEDWQLVDRLPEDPVGSLSYAKVTPDSVAMAQISWLDENDLMPTDDLQKIVDAAHSGITEDTGLVEANIGTTKYGKHYGYTIIRVLLKPHGVAYVLNLHLCKDHQAVSLTGRFTERGVTGKRETTALEYCIRKGEVESGTLKGWVQDPYDKNFTKGKPSNLSERRCFDISFRTHPLSELRKLLNALFEFN